MGNCVFSSYDETTSQVSTAKVVVHDGRMQEFSYPVKVSYLLQLYPACFICDSDELGFDDVVTAVHEDEELRPGQLYFALPLTRLKRHLPPQEMAALAVVATSALAKCGSRRKQIVFLSSCDVNTKPGRKVAPEGTVGNNDVARKGRSKIGGRGMGKFTATLSSIPEQG